MRSIAEAYDHAVALEAREGSEDPLSIGPVESFPESEILTPERPILVHNGQVYIVSLPCDIHQSMTGELIKAMNKSMAQVFPPEEGQIFEYQVALQRIVQNMVGCHSSFGKLPDATYGTRTANRIKIPTLVVEVGVHHEGLSALLKEAVSWFSLPQLEYVILVKVWVDDEHEHVKGVRIILVERDEERLSVWRHKSRALCTPLPLQRLLADSPMEMLQNIYPLRIIADIRYFCGDPIPEAALALDPFRLTARNTAFLHRPWLQIDLRLLLEEACASPSSAIKIEQVIRQA